MKAILNFAVQRAESQARLNFPERKQSRALLKTLFLLFVTAVCLTSDTAISSVPQASATPSLSECSYSPVSNGPMPKYWEYQKLDLRSVTGESFLADGFVPVME